MGSTAPAFAPNIVNMYKIHNGEVSSSNQHMSSIYFLRTAFSQFGEMTGWSEEQLVALKNKAVAVYGQTSTWDGGVLSTANVIIGKFTYCPAGRRCRNGWHSV